MTIMEKEDGQISSALTPISNKDPERQKIEQQVADFQNNGGSVEAIPTGLSGSMYSARPLTAKQSREKLKLALKSQRGANQ